MNIEIWLEDVDGEYEAIKIAGEAASNFRVPELGTEIGCWQDDIGSPNGFILLTVHGIRIYVFRKPEDTVEGLAKLPVWTQEIHILCSNAEYPGLRRRG